MKTVYVTNRGHDKNDGLSPVMAVRSWERAKKIKGGNNSTEMFVSSDASFGESSKRPTKPTSKTGEATKGLSGSRGRPP